MAWDFGAEAKTIQMTAPAMTRPVKTPASTLKLLQLMGISSPLDLCGKDENAQTEPQSPVLRVPTMSDEVTVTP